jgi:hypothetical protein
MPRAQKLKVYRTPIGFHDAYVAAPSQKAALEAWGSDADLFARKVAEQVTDPKLMAQPLAHPGEVIRKLRGTAEEQLASLPSAAKQRASKHAPKSRPRPSRAAVDEAEKALAELDTRQQEERAQLASREAALARERSDLEARQRKALDKAAKARDRAEAAYEKALAKWRG